MGIFLATEDHSYNIFFSAISYLMTYPSGWLLLFLVSTIFISLYTVFIIKIWIYQRFFICMKPFQFSIGEAMIFSRLFVKKSKNGIINECLANFLIWTKVKDKNQ